MSLINEMFPKALFTVAMDIKKLKETISNESEICIYFKRDCDCFKGTKIHKSVRLYNIKSKDNQPLTNEYVLKILEEKRFNPMCEHRFVKGFYRIEDNINNYHTFDIILTTHY